MVEWFRAGGFMSYVILAVGMGAIGFGARAAIAPSAERVATLRTLTALVLTVALFAYGGNMWAINEHLTNDAFLKANDITPANLPFTALIGVTEASQALSLGALLATVAVVLRLVAEAKLARASRS